MAKNKNVEVNFRLFEIDKVFFYENPIDSSGTTGKIDVKNLKLRYSIDLHYNNKTHIISIPFQVDFDIKDIDIFGIKTIHEFEIQNPEISAKESKKGVYDIPNDFIRTLIAITISTTRGILFESLSNPEYKKYKLPLLNPTKILDQLQNSGQ